MTSVGVAQAKNEVKVLNSLNHPNIVKYYECYQERNMMHIIMEFCQVSLPHTYSHTVSKTDTIKTGSTD